MSENATLSFYTEATALTNATASILSPTTGIIRRITISWPSGCNFLVEALFRVKNYQIVPTPSTGGEFGLRFDGWTEQITPDYPITINDRVEMFIVNHDAVNTHKISAMMFIEGLSESEIADIRPAGTKICRNKGV